MVAVVSIPAVPPSANDENIKRTLIGDCQEPQFAFLEGQEGAALPPRPPAQISTDQAIELGLQCRRFQLATPRRGMDDTFDGRCEHTPCHFGAGTVVLVGACSDKRLVTT